MIPEREVELESDDGKDCEYDVVEPPVMENVLLIGSPAVRVEDRVPVGDGSIASALFREPHI